MGSPIRNVDELGDAVRQTIRAFHGSPYDFDKFDASKIGTGEGLQAYGHGLYFASDEGVARHYRDALAPDEDIEVPHLLSEEMNQVWREYNEIASKYGDWSRANAAGDHKINPFTEARDSAAAALSDVQKRVHEATRNPGRLYEVEIGHPEESMLNWDMPTAPAGGVGARAADVLRAVRPRDISESDLGYIRSVRFGNYSQPVFGSSIHGVESALRDMVRDPAGAAELRSAGIPGVRYLDGISRQQGGGTKNYVVFPGAEDAIRILRKYGWMIPATLAADAAIDGERPGQVAR